jgi:hypothetical protein
MVSDLQNGVGGTLRAMILGKTSVLWLRMTMEDLIKGAEVKIFIDTV